MNEEEREKSGIYGKSRDVFFLFPLPRPHPRICLLLLSPPVSLSLPLSRPFAQIWRRQENHPGRKGEEEEEKKGQDRGSQPFRTTTYFETQKDMVWATPQYYALVKRSEDDRKASQPKGWEPLQVRREVFLKEWEKTLTTLLPPPFVSHTCRRRFMQEENLLCLILPY